MLGATASYTKVCEIPSYLTSSFFVFYKQTGLTYLKEGEEEGERQTEIF